MIHEKSYFRVIQHDSLSAKENMATDDALLSSYENGNEPILRLYSWENSFTIGVSQKFENYPITSVYKGNYAKRITGGGVLFHGHDLSYSLVIPTSLLEGFNIKESYEKICSFLFSSYKQKVSFILRDKLVFRSFDSVNSIFSMDDQLFKN